MIYVMSDLHGCFDKYLKMIEKIDLRPEKRKKVLTYLWHSGIFVEIEVNGKNYFLSHTVPEKEVMIKSEKCDLESFILGEPDYELTYFDDKVIVTGHTPTGLIDKAYTGRIYIKNNHIAVDCGAVFENGRLGCICLDYMEEFYI